MPHTNKKLQDARKGKNDEFYTQMEDIEKELQYYERHFFNKVVYCNCDDPTHSNFVKYFEINFEKLGLKKLIATYYDRNNTPYKFEVIKGECGLIRRKTQLQGDGDFRSSECVEILKESDIICTNPPFSLFREYISQLIEHDKKFLIIGNVNAVDYKKVFSMIKKNKLWLGISIRSGDREFELPTDYQLFARRSRTEKNKNFVRVTGVRWYTNLEHGQRPYKLVLNKRYTPDEYPKYDNYDAINVNKTIDIPYDYEGVMGVPITFLDKYDPEQFEIIGCNKLHGEPVGYHKEGTSFDAVIAGRAVYKRLFIRRKKISEKA